MATRSRLGRDPLREVAQPGKKAPRPTPKGKGQAIPKNALNALPPVAVPSVPAPTPTSPPFLEPIPEGKLPNDTHDEPLRESSVRKTPSVPRPEVATPPPNEAPHPVEAFLRGVLEGITPTGNVRLSVVVEAETFALPVEKLFYFSHALQLILSPFESPDEDPAVGSLQETPDQCPVLSARLQNLPGDRHVLRFYDNGHFFRSRFATVSLAMEALQPLVAFVVKRHGSILLRQGQAVEFEIID